MTETDTCIPKKEEIIMELLKWLVQALIISLILSFIFNKIIIIGHVPSESMENTLNINDRVIGNRLAYRKEVPKTGDIIIFRLPDDPEQLFVKRIIGVPGDHIKIQKDFILINGKKISEPYIKETMLPKRVGYYVVPEKYYFVLGDNRNNSYDSRFWDKTYVPEENIIARVDYIIYPKIKKLR